MLVLLSGCSGAGKNTVIQALTNKNKNIKFLQSCTTRKPRPHEPKDIYQFVSKQQFDDMQKNGEIFEYEEIHQNFYGITKSSLAQIVEDDKKGIHYIKDIGVLGQINLSRALKNKVAVVSIFLEVPHEELISRLQKRGEKDIDLRLSRMEFEMGYINNFDEIILNVNIKDTVTRIENIIEKKTKIKEKEWLILLALVELLVLLLV